MKERDIGHGKFDVWLRNPPPPWMQWTVVVVSQAVI